MEDLYYFGTDFGNPFVVRGDWPDISRKSFIDYFNAIGVKPADPGIVPEFETGNTVENPDGTSTPLNSDYFASEKTANELMTRFGADRVAVIPYVGSGGLEKSDAKERWLVWRDGAVNAGQLAVRFRIYPEMKYPHVAEKECWRLLASGKQALPNPGN